MKMRISIIGSLLVVFVLNVGCATHDLAYEKSRFRNPNRTAVATTTTPRNQLDPNLPAVAEAPRGAGTDMSWGGSHSPRY